MTSIELAFKQPKSEKRKGMCYICIKHNGHTRMIPTSTKVYATEWDEKRRIIIVKDSHPTRMKELGKEQKRLADQIDGLEMSAKILEGEKRPYTINDILLQEYRWKLQKSFFALVNSRIGFFRDEGKDSTANNYACALNSFKNFRSSKDISLHELSPVMMGLFQNYLIRSGLKMNTISLYMRNLRAAYNYAVDEGILAENKRPFRKVFTGLERTRKRALKKEVVKELMTLPLEREPELDFARDLFMFSIYTQGMPFVDIAKLTKEKIRNGYICYKRSKTNQSLEIAILPNAQAIMDKYMDIRPDTPYIFPILYKEGKNGPIKYRSALREHNKRLRLISERMGLQKPLSSYVPRHTWASLAKWSGVDDTVISEAMGHTNIATTTIYLASLDLDVIGSANHAVISSLMK